MCTFITLQVLRSFRSHCSLLFSYLLSLSAITVASPTRNALVDKNLLLYTLIYPPSPTRTYNSPIPSLSLNPPIHFTFTFTFTHNLHPLALPPLLSHLYPSHTGHRTQTQVHPPRPHLQVTISQSSTHPPSTHPLIRPQPPVGTTTALQTPTQSSPNDPPPLVVLTRPQSAIPKERTTSHSSDPKRARQA
jgi:hypothetical protein